jgi:hypothetical protein
MRSNKHGGATSGAEVVHVSSHGFWVFLEARDRELFLPFRQFPWFADASIRELSRIEVERDHILRWPGLDVDLDVDRIEHPERYPLVARSLRARPHKARRRSERGKRRTPASSQPAGSPKRKRPGSKRRSAE